MDRHDELPIDPDRAPDDPGEPRPGPRATAPPRSEVRRARPDVVVAIALGGAIGTTLRAALGQVLSTPAPQFPSTTLGINIVGSFALGVLVVVLLSCFGPTPRLRPFLTTGILGGFTTFSTFVVEAVQLVRHDRPGVAIASVAVSAVGGIAAALAGITAGHAVAARIGFGRSGADTTEDTGGTR